MNRPIPWNSLGAVLLNKARPLNQTTFKEFFKLSVPVADYVFRKILRSFRCVPTHFLCTLHYLKSRNPIDEEIAAVLGIHQDTLRNYVHDTLRKLINVLPQVLISLLE